MISGVHLILYSVNAEADRAFIRDVLGFRSVDAHPGWPIFAFPPAEAAVHPGEANDRHEIYFMCPDLEAEVVSLASRGVQCTAIQRRDWGLLTSILLPGGGAIGLYEPHHPTAL